MRYFKYKNTNKNFNNAIKEQYKTLTKEEKRAARKNKFWKILGAIVGTVILLLTLITGSYWISLIPSPLFWLWKFLVNIGRFFLLIIWLIIAFLSAFIFTLPITKKIESFHSPSMKKEFFSKACQHLRDYYGFGEPYVVTKCYDSSDEKFKNHDVCIFIYDNELRITVDLIHGFLHGHKDLGCYTFQKEEISLSKQHDENRLIAKLEADNTVFMLGYRAKGFIERNFLQGNQ